MKWCMAGLVWIGLMLPLAARAEEPAGGKKAAGNVEAQQLSDVVRLKNGGFFRGIITELVPNDHVAITLASGEQRRFAWSEVEYAGPVAKDPAGAAKATELEDLEEDEEDVEEVEPARSGRSERRPFITVHAEEASLKLEASEPNITFYIKTGTATARRGLGSVTATGYDLICTAPCTASLPAGTHEMAYSRPHEEPNEFDSPVTLRGGNETLRADIDDHSALKTVGAITLVVGLLGGATLIATSDPDDGWGAQRVVGLIGGGVGTLVGIGLFATPESATLKVSSRESEWE